MRDLKGGVEIDDSWQHLMAILKIIEFYMRNGKFQTYEAEYTLLKVTKVGKLVYENNRMI